MPRVIRVDDVDNDATHPGDPGPNKMVENDATMWLDEGASNGGSASVSVADLLGVASLDIPEAELSRVYEQVQADRRAGIQTSRQEYLEGAGGGDGSNVGTNLPAGEIGTIQEPPPGADGAHPDWNTYDEIPSNEFVEWLPGKDSRVDPAVYETARRMSQSLGVKLQCTSGYRNRQYNANCGGASNSNHMYGKAMDLLYIGGSAEERRRMLVAAIEAGAKGIGLYNSFIHIDNGPFRTWGLPHPSWAVETMRAAGHRT